MNEQNVNQRPDGVTATSWQEEPRWYEFPEFVGDDLPSKIQFLRNQLPWRSLYLVGVRTNPYTTPEWQAYTDEWGAWGTIMKLGRSYMVGEETPWPVALKRLSSNLTTWQQIAARIAWDHPEISIEIDNDQYNWVVCRRGEYIDLGLPHQDHGGEKNWVTRDGRRRVLVNVD